MWQVSIGGVGRVHDGHDEAGARETYALYVSRSILGLGAAAHKQVTLWEGDTCREAHDPDQPKTRDLCAAMANAGKGHWAHVGTRAIQGLVTVRWSGGRWYAEYRGQDDLLGQGATPIEALTHLQQQIKGLIEALQEVL